MRMHDPRASRHVPLTRLAFFNLALYETSFAISSLYFTFRLHEYLEKVSSGQVSYFLTEYNNRVEQSLPTSAENAPNSRQTGPAS